MRTPKISIVILTYNQHEYTRECLLSLQEINYSNYEIIVVDNASEDGSVQKLTKEFPNIGVIRNSRNLGVSGGRNAGVRLAIKKGTDYVMFLDNDTVVDPDAIGELVLVAESDTEIGGVSPKVYYHNSRIICSTIGIVPSLIFRPRTRGGGETDSGQYDEIVEGDWLSGCAGLFKREVFEKVGYLDETFSPYGAEDTDWGIRVRNAGYRLVYTPSAKVWHNESSKSTEDPRKNYHIIRATIILWRKHIKPAAIPLTMLWFIYDLGKHISKFLIRRDWLFIRSIRLGIKDGARARITKPGYTTGADAPIFPLSLKPFPKA